jgi:type I restriction enzyme S subunit
VAILRVNEHITPQYAYYIFSSQIFLNQLMLKTNASAQGGVYLGTLSNSVIKLPKNISEQKQVVNILTTQDKKIETEEKNLAKLKELKKGLMDDLLSGKVRVRV